MDIQKLLDAMSDGWRRTRSDYHLTLGGAISGLSTFDPLTPIRFSHGGSPGRVQSYRGYYSDLAFPTVGDALVGAVLADLNNALGRAFEGYKGGDFLMGADTPLWVSEYGCGGGLAIVNLIAKDGELILVTKQIAD